MRRDFLKGLGIEDKDLIDKILDENSADIGKAKGELETYKTKVTDLENQIKTKDGEIDTLKKSVGDTNALNETIKQLEADKTQLTNDLNTKVSQIQKAHAIESGVRDAKAKNVKAVMALLDMDKITFEDGVVGGLTEQLTALQSDESSSFMFGDAVAAPAGTHLKNPPANGGGNPPTGKSFVEAIAQQINANKK